MLSYAINGQRNMSITRVLLIDTGTYNDQFLRPYEMKITHQVEQEVRDRIQTSNGKFSNLTFHDIHNQILSPSEKPEAQVGIINGWETRRLRFLIEIEIDTKVGGKVIERVTGYTDHAGILNGNVDPNMTLFINNTARFREVTFMTPNGPVKQYQKADNSQIIADNTFQGIRSHQQYLSMMRPEDVFGTIATQSYVDNVNTIDVSHVVNHTATKNARSNNNPAEYLTSLYNAYQDAFVASSDFGQTSSDIYDQAKNAVRSPSAATDSFINAIRNIRGEMSLPTNHFRYADLLMLDPTIESRVTYITKTANVERFNHVPTHERGATQGWHGYDYHTSAANMIAQAIPGMMIDCGIAMIAFRSSNFAGGNQFMSVVTAAEGFVNVDLSNDISNFLRRVELELMTGLSLNHQIAFGIEVFSDFLNDSRITITINNESITFVMPTFCDSILSPVITMDRQRINGLAENLEYLLTDSLNAKQDRLNSMQFAQPPSMPTNAYNTGTDPHFL